MTAPATAQAEKIVTSLEAQTLYDRADSALGLWKADGEEVIHLFRGEVVENDSPGSGRSDDPDIEPFFSLGGATELRKVLRLDEPACLGAQLGFIGKEDNDNQATLRFLVNGVEVLRPPSAMATPEARQYRELGWSRWYYVAVPPEALKEGDNEIRVATVDGRAGWQLMVADYRDFHKGMEDPVVLPHASSRSDDGGATWSPERGEYVMRLLLDRYREQGQLRSPVLDVAGHDEKPVKLARTVAGIRADWPSDLPEGTELAVSLRTGPTPTVDSADWTEWLPCESGVSLAEVGGRYLQARPPVDA